MKEWLLVLALAGGITWAPQGLSQTRPSGSGSELTTVVQSAIHAATPTPETFSTKIWTGLDVKTSIPREQFKSRYDGVQKDLRHHAQAQLQRLSELLRQLNTINALVICAYEINNNPELTGLLTETSSVNHWSDVMKTWGNMSDEISCVAGDRLQGQPGGLASVIQDADVRGSLEDSFKTVQIAIANVNESVKSRNQQHLVVSVSQLKSSVALFYVVSSVQVARLTKDITNLANSQLGSTANTPEADAVLEKLERLLKAPPQ